MAKLREIIPAWFVSWLLLSIPTIAFFGLFNLSTAVPGQLVPLRTTSSQTLSAGIRTNPHRGAQTSSYVKRSSSAIAITADGATLLAVSPDSDSLALIDLGPPPKVTKIAVGDDPRTVTVNDTGSHAYVANRGANSVSVIDLSLQQEVAQIAVGDRPYGVLVSPDGRQLYVAEQGSDRLTILNTTTLEKLHTIAVADRPSGLAIAPDGRTLYLTHLMNNTITVLNPQPLSLYLPAILNSAAPALHVRTSRAVSPAQNPIPVSSIPLWANSNLVQSIVIAPGGLLAYVPHTRANSSNQALTLDTTVFPLVSVIDLPLRAHLIGQQFNLEILDPPAVGLPFDAAFSPDGTELWVLNAASNDVTVIEMATRQRLAHIEVGHNPQGIVIAPDGDAAYVNNTLSGTVSVISTAQYTATSVITTTTIPLSPTLLTGKRLFFSSDDPRMGKDQWMSCNTCHFDGENDAQTWFLGFAGPRNTKSLLGMSQTLPLRWSGEWDEAADSEFAIRMDSFGSGLVEGEMHCSLDPPDCLNHPPHAGISAELDALAAYINSLIVPLSPEHQQGQPLTPAEKRGQALFSDPSVGCVSCHPPSLYTDNLTHDVGTATPDERIGPAFNTPSLNGLYDTAPYLHDGSAKTLEELLARTSPGGEHAVVDQLTETEIADLIAFLSALPFE